MELIKAPPLAEQLCFDLYAASRAVTAAYRPVLTELGLTYPQYLVLIVLWEHQSRTVRELAVHLRLDHGTLTPLLKRMERSAWSSAAATTSTSGTSWSPWRPRVRPCASTPSGSTAT